MKLKLISAIICLSIAGCVSNPESDPAYVSPTHYSDYNCNQINAEMKRISDKIEQLDQRGKTRAAEAALETALAVFAISQGYGVSSSDDNNNIQYRHLANQYDVLEKTAIKKECIR